MTKTLITVGNIYIDHNIFGIDTGGEFRLEPGKDYLAKDGEQVVGGSSTNVALQLKNLGNNVAITAKIGNDAAGEQIKSLLLKAGISSDLISVGEGLTTSMVVNIVALDGEFTGVHYGDASMNLTIEDIDLDNHLVKEANGIYFGGTIKQPKLFNQCEAMFKKLSSRGIKVFYDPNRFPALERFVDRTLLYKQLAYVEGYFPNLQELLQITDHTDIDDALNSIIKSGVGFIAVKLGSKGCRVKTSKLDFTVSGHEIEPLTTIGAGDCFNATFMSYYLDGYSLEQCAEYAIGASAIKVAENSWPSKYRIETGKLSFDG